MGCACGTLLLAGRSTARILCWMGHGEETNLLHWLGRQDTANTSLHVKQERRDKIMDMEKEQRNASVLTHPIEWVGFFLSILSVPEVTAQPQLDGIGGRGERDAAAQGPKEPREERAGRGSRDFGKV